MNAFGGSASCINDSGARLSVSHAQFCPTRPSGSCRGRHGLDVPDELLGLAGRNRAIDAAIGCHFSSGAFNMAIGGSISAPTGDALTSANRKYTTIAQLIHRSTHI